MLTKNVWRVNENELSKHNRLRSIQNWLWKMINTRAIINVLAVMLSLAAGSAHAASLNKCVDAYGKVTYSNLPCKGANEVRKIEIDPAPPVPPPAPVPVQPKVEVPVYVMPDKFPGPGTIFNAPPGPVFPPAMEPASKPSRAPLDKKATIKFETLGGPKKQSQNTCDALTDKLGLVLDKMDAARRKGYTSKEMDKWNLDIKALERQKQQAGCF